VRAAVAGSHRDDRLLTQPRGGTVENGTIHSLEFALRAHDPFLVVRSDGVACVRHFSRGVGARAHLLSDVVGVLVLGAAGQAVRSSLRGALPMGGSYTDILHMLTKRLTKIGDSTGIVIDRPILDMLGLDKGDEVSLRIDKDKLIIERADESVTRSKRQAKLEKARARMHGDVGGTLRKLAK
jgi:antitoxin component of MazEF toxin-antitoxin module